MSREKDRQFSNLNPENLSLSEIREQAYKQGLNDGIAKANEPRGTYQCMHCGSYSVIWDGDFDFEDMGYEGEGVVNCCHCANCGAEIEYRVRTDTEDEN